MVLFIKFGQDLPNLLEKQKLWDILKIRCNTVFTDSVCDCILVVSRRSVKCKKKYFRPSLADIDTFHPNQETESKHPSILIIGG